MPDRHHTTDQLGLDFEGPSRERMAVFKAKLAAISPEVAGLSPSRLEKVVRLLDSVFWSAGACPDRYAQPSPEWLEENVDQSRSALGRTKTDAARLGVFRAERPRQRRGEPNRPYRLYLEHDAIDRLVAASRQSAAACAGSGGSRWEPVGSGGIRWEPTKETPLPPNSKTPSPPPPTPRPTPPALQVRRGSFGWGEVLKTLEDEGVGLAAESVEAARAAGCTPADVAAVVEAYRAAKTPEPPAWGPGALALRVRRCRPGVGPLESWPPPSAGHATAKQRVAHDERRRQEDARAAARRDAKDASAAAMAAERCRLAELRAAAEATPRTQLDAWFDTLEPFVARVARRDPYGSLALEAIADRLTAAQLLES